MPDTTKQMTFNGTVEIDNLVTELASQFADDLKTDGPGCKKTKSAFIRKAILFLADHVKHTGQMI